MYPQLMILNIIITAQILLCFGVYYDDEPVVNTKYGFLQGRYARSNNGRKYLSFTKIPYAQPPEGENRFKAPMPPKRWAGIRSATEQAPVCIQKNYLRGLDEPVEGQEDCLYLNVYTPMRSGVPEESLERLPVMVFFHWGAFIAGYSNENYLGPQYFMDKDVVLVTLSYRLGVMGFLSTNDDAAPGNWGLKDQIAALRWVNENIENFSGDPNNITIFGQSAGAGSTHLHMLSPLAKGLFHRVISQSGASLNLWAKPLNAIQKTVAVMQGVLVGCNETDSEALVACLRNVDPVLLVQSSINFKYFDVEPYTPYTVVTEKKTATNPEPYLLKEPKEMLEKGEFTDVPWMVGVVQDEGIIRAAPLLRMAAVRKQLNGALNELMPKMLALDISTTPANVNTVWSEIKDFYLGGGNQIDVDNPDSVQGFINMYSERAFVFGVYQSALVQADRGNSPVWLYNFAYKGEHSYGDYFAITTEDINFKWGVCHCDDLLYLFKSPALFPELSNPNDLKMRDKMIEIWTNFASNGDPLRKSGYKLSYLNDHAIKKKNLYYFNITGSADTDIQIVKQTEFAPKRVKFWENLHLAEYIGGL